MGVELGGARGLDGSDDHRKIFGKTTGHDGIDGNFLDGALDQVRRHDGDDVLGVASGARKHSHHPFGGWGHNRKTIAPPTPKHLLPLVVASGEVDSAGCKQGAVELDGKLFGHSRLDGARSATGPPHWHRCNVLSERLWSVIPGEESCPLLGIPPNHTARFESVFKSHDRWNSFDREPP